jgi:hypothetical protein
MSIVAEESGMRVFDVPSAEEALEMLEISSVNILRRASSGADGIAC